MNPLRSNAAILSENKRFIDELAEKINSMPCWATLIVFLAVATIVIWVVDFFNTMYKSKSEGFE